jgi:mRNA interferase HigB
MHVISRRPLRDFAARHPAADPPLRSWFKLMKASRASNLAELKQTFPTVSYVLVKTVTYVQRKRHEVKHEIYVFNVGGNNYRVVTEINFTRHKAYVRFVLSHGEYDTDQWKGQL